MSAPIPDQHKATTVAHVSQLNVLQRPRRNHRKRTRTCFGAEREVTGLPKKRRLSQYAKPRKWDRAVTEEGGFTTWQQTSAATEIDPSASTEEDCKMTSRWDVPAAPDIAFYNDQIYQTYLSSRSWTRAETDVLYDTCKNVRSLSWSIITERYNQRKPPLRRNRTSIELKERFFEVQNVLSRLNGNNRPNLSYDFDAEVAQKSREKEEQYHRRTHEENASLIRLVKEHRRTTIDLKREIQVQLIDRAPLIEEHERFVNDRISSSQVPLPGLPPQANRIDIGYGVVIEDTYNPRPTSQQPREVPGILCAAKEDVYHITCSEKIVSRETELKGTAHDGKPFVVVFPPPQQPSSSGEASTSATPKKGKKRKNHDRQNSTTPPSTEAEINRRISKDVMDELFKTKIIDPKTGLLAVGSRELVNWFQILRDDMIQLKAYELYEQAAKAKSSSATVSN